MVKLWGKKCKMRPAWRREGEKKARTGYDEELIISYQLAELPMQLKIMKHRLSPSKR